MTMRPEDARIVDPVLSTHAQGYVHADRVGSILFPRVDVNTNTGNVIKFGKESFQLYNARRAPGSATKQIDFGWQGQKYELYQDSLDCKIPRETLREGGVIPGSPGVDFGMRAVGVTMNSLTLTLESEQAAIATDLTKYDDDHKSEPTGNDKWSDEDSDPIAQIEDAKEAVRNSTGMYPNVGVLSAIAYKAIKTHPVIVDRFKFTAGGAITAQMLATLFELEKLVVGKAVYADDDGAFVDIWGNNAIFAYAPQQVETAPHPGVAGGIAATFGNERPSFGYTYTLKGHPFVEKERFDANTKSFIFGTTYERAPILTGVAAGFLIKNPA